VKYRVTLKGMAIVTQTQTVEAVSEEEAGQIAQEQVSEFAWDYEELYDGRAGRIEVVNCREVR